MTYHCCSDDSFSTQVGTTMRDRINPTTAGPALSETSTGTPHTVSGAQLRLRRWNRVVLKQRNSSRVNELPSHISVRIMLMRVDDVYDVVPLQSITVDANGIDVASRRFNGAADAACVRAAVLKPSGRGMEIVAIRIGSSRDGAMPISQGQRVGSPRYLAAFSAISAAPLSAMATRTA